MSTFARIVVPGEAIPKARPRHGRGGHVYTPRQTVEYEATVGWAGRQAMRGRKPTRARLWVQIDFYGVAYLEDGDDIDNCIKSIFDGLNKIVWHDDRQVDRIVAERHPDPRARTEITVTERSAA